MAGHWCFVVVAGLASVLSAAVTGDLGSGTLAAGTMVSAAAIVTIFRVTSGRPQNGQLTTPVWAVLAILAMMSVAALGAGIAFAVTVSK